MMETELDLTNVGKQAPLPPYKFDIIPIHTSDRITFKDCRRRWAWSSPSRLNLTRKVRISGITWPLFFGTGIHYALERYYNPGIKEDPAVTFAAWLDLHWEGGLVTETDIKEFGLEDREPVKRLDGSYEVTGLKFLLPDNDPTPYETHRDLGIGMMEFYKGYAQREDNFSVISTEHDFSVPILTPEGSVLYMQDNRIMPVGWEPNLSLENEYGPLMYWEDIGPNAHLMKQVHSRGRMDKVVQDNETGQFGIHDYKTSARQLDDDYFRHLDLDEQCTTYLYSSEREAQMYGLEYMKLDYIIYEAILKGYPSPPTMLKSGMPSISRTTETTTAHLFEQCIKENGLQIMYDLDDKWQAYYAYLLDIGDKRFVNRRVVYRNAYQKKACGDRLYYEAMDMLNDPFIYPNPTKNYTCLNCAFRSPCIMQESGSDYIGVLEDAYQSNYDR